MVLPRIRSGLDGGEAVVAIRIRKQTASAMKIRIEGRGMIVTIMAISSGGVRLPDFDQRVWNRAATIIQNPAADDDALTQGLSLALSCHIAIRGTYVVRPKDRPCDL